MRLCRQSPVVQTASIASTHRMHTLNRLASQLTALALTAVVAWGAGCGEQAPVEQSADTSIPPATAEDSSQEPEAEQAAEKASTPEAEPAVSTADYDAVEGQWYRADGGYVIVIEEAKRDGRLKAGYFNPNPINVAKAEASEKDGKIHVFVELRDQSYPGCTYNLTYDADRDTLEGTYFQAAVKQTYDVLFVRMQQ